jgi:serine/threonine protein kinase
LRACPACRRLYLASASFCQADGKALVSAGRVEIPRDPEDDRVGSVLLGRYRVFRVVADGGMARVYEALDESRQHNVALKILHRELAEDPVSVERFRREFRVGSQLLHPNIVGVLDFRAAADGSQVLVMEFLGGEELRSLLKREGPIGGARAVRLLSQAALGLDFAHAHGWVHRDLKPENLFLCQTPEGDVLKILDFGSVKDSSGGSKPLTVIGTTIGSPYYMSPEQAQGLVTLDHRTDVWALAVVLYESLTGRVPFEGNNGPSILMQILAGQPTPPSRLLTGEPNALGRLDRAVARALTKEPTQRSASVGDFADELGRALGLSGSHTVWAETSQAELERVIGARIGHSVAAAGRVVSQPAPPAFPLVAPDYSGSAPAVPLAAPRSLRWSVWLACALVGFVTIVLLAWGR